MKIPRAFTSVRSDAGTPPSAPLTEPAPIPAPEAPRDLSQIDISWLPFSAKTFHISPNIEDYVLMNVPICPSDFPNRNGVAFPLAELVRYQPPPISRQAYKAWIGQPVHFEHDNEDCTKAYGVILDVVLSRIVGYGNDAHWKVMGLLAIDRKKNPGIAQEVADGKIRTGSMGAMADHFTCSVCGREATDNPIKNCGHIGSTKDLNWRLVQHEGRTHVAYLNAHGISPFEYSLVRDPAWVVAESDVVFNWK